MPGFAKRNGIFLLGILLLPRMAAGAAPASAGLLPPGTKQHLSIPNVQQFNANWGRTQLAKLLEEPKVKPVADDLRRQTYDPLGLGVSWDDFTAAAAGEVSWAVVQLTPKLSAQVLTVDGTGKTQQVKAFVQKMTANLKKQGHEATEQRHGDEVLTVHERQAGEKRKRIAVVVKDDVLLVSDDLSVVAGILGRWGSSKDSLATTKAYSEVGKRSQMPNKDRPDLFWFIDPIGWAEIQQAASAQPAKGADFVKTLKAEGFDAFKGAGGVVRFAVGERDLVHRTAFYAPTPYRKSMRMLRFFPDKRYEPLPWVPDDLAVHSTAYYDVKNSFETMDSLMDLLLDSPGGFEKAIRKVRDGANGPKVDIPKEVIGRLGHRVTVLGDTELPVGFSSDRFLMAIETSDAKRLKAAVKRYMDNDPDTVSHPLPDNEIWEVLSQPQTANQKKDGMPRGEIPNGGIAVAHNQLLVCSHFPMLKKILTEKNPRKRPAGWDRVSKELDKQGEGQDCVRLFARCDESFRTAYEFLRHNQLAEASSFRAQLFYLLVEGGGSRKIDGRKLPEFKEISGYLGLAGVAVTNQRDGWLAVGFVLKK